ncbi:winged helix-turn-helix domain-containing protein (plasmid) [Cyanobacterium sp. IPPAS B-1200]|uniref:hypothetical protein n=1 Tax=Cyanobacterium sp. IPPAS B-1200 TaxID=1562720 RepID=UPI00090207CD|nr:hypothetical protein [Cyanobacterium sp. IPPAS B-1200]
MYNLVFIQARGGQTMSERLVEIIRECPQGCTAMELSEKVNRPISMINTYIKGLIRTKQVRTRIHKKSGKRLIYSRL